MTIDDYGLEIIRKASIETTGGLSFAGDLQNWYRCGDGDSYPLVLDNAGTDNLTMSGMSSASFKAEVP